MRKADACTKPGELGALLRREGLYSSHLTAWRQQRDHGVLEATTPKKRGRKSKADDALVKELAKVRREKAALERKLRQAETIIEVQKNLGASRNRDSFATLGSSTLSHCVIAGTLIPSGAPRSLLLSTWP